MGIRTPAAAKAGDVPSSVSCAQASKGQRLACVFSAPSSFPFFSKATTEKPPGDSAGFWLSKADLKTLTRGSRFQVEILPTIVSKVAKQNGSFNRPYSRRS